MTRSSPDLADARQALHTDLGPEAFVDAAGIVGIFNGLVRCADLTGIPLDDSTRERSHEFRAALGLNAFPGAVNSVPDKPAHGT